MDTLFALLRENLLLIYSTDNEPVKQSYHIFFAISLRKPSNKP